MKWLLRVPSLLAICVSPMFFPKASAESDYAEANLHAVSIRLQDLPSEFRLYTQCDCIWGPEPPVGLLNGLYRSFVNEKGTTLGVAATNESIDMYGAPAQAHAFFEYFGARAEMKVNGNPKEIYPGSGIVTYHWLTIPTVAPEQGAYLGTGRSAGTAFAITTLYFHAFQFAGWVTAVGTSVSQVRSEGIHLTRLLVRRIRANG